ncbi:MAG: molybdopterin cofactor-binding domain-containing protein [Woeseiaceae bacterium]|nr:molybdopterin cofactor-binding domain-containing protein [Woeseiaceae bacterium]
MRNRRCRFCQYEFAAPGALDRGVIRGESFLSDLHGRDHVSRAQLALDADGRFLALRVSISANIGAYCSQAGPYIPWFGASMSTGCYNIPAAHVAVEMILTNTVPVDAYRGAGRPEAAYLIERLVDKAARQTGMDRCGIEAGAIYRAGSVPVSVRPLAGFTIRVNTRA